MLDWVQGVPQQFVFTASGKIHDLKATAALRWSAGWTYLFDRGYFSFDLLTTLLNVGAHFVIRLKQGVGYRIIRSNPVPDVKAPAGIRAIKFDQIVSLPGWASDVILRLVVYQLTVRTRGRCSFFQGLITTTSSSLTSLKNDQDRG